MFFRAIVYASFALASVAAWTCPAALFAQEEPATIESAAKVLDLRTFPIPKDGELVSYRRVAQLTYQSTAALSDAVAYVKGELQKGGWKEFPESYSDAQFASATFELNGFRVSLSASPAVSGDGKNRTGIVLTQHGNIDLEKIPRPADLQKLFAGPVNSIYLSPASVEDTVKQCTEALLKNGWTLYSGPTDVPLFFKRNAVRLSVFVVAAPAQQNKTSVTYSAELMSVELDPPPKSTRIQYADSTTTLSFDTPLSIDEVVAFYPRHLAPKGWQPTTDKPIKISLYDTMLFRNQPMDMLTLELNTVEGQTRGLLKFETAAEVEELEKAGRAIAEKMAEAAEKMEQQRAGSKLAIPVPKEATELEVTEDRLEFQLPSGKAAPVLRALRKFLVDAGWKEEVVSDDSAAGVFNYELNSASIQMTCVDPGFIPAEVTLSGSGVTLEKR